MKRIIFPALALVAVVGCVPPTTSAYGPAPEMTFPLAKAGIVKARIIGDMTKNGYTIARSDENTLVMIGELEGIGNTLAYGTKFNSSPGVRITFAIFPVDDEIMWRANAVAVVNPGSAFEKASHLHDSHPVFSEIHGYMSQVKSLILQRQM